MGSDSNVIGQYFTLLTVITLTFCQNNQFYLYSSYHQTAHSLVVTLQITRQSSIHLGILIIKQVNQYEIVLSY